ncbi:hypothetical protein [Dictyobacter halimunensis]|uniref:hypothetical protein n=1 Tax=Dictyobacter halimunensis TaxID=3026934 RepID=UPI0030C6C41C
MLNSQVLSQSKDGRRGIDILVANLRTRFRVDHAFATLGALSERAPAELLLLELHTSDTSVRQGVAVTFYETHPELLPQLVPELVEMLCTGKVRPPLQDILVAQVLARYATHIRLCLRGLIKPWTFPIGKFACGLIVGLSQMSPHIPMPTIKKFRSLLDDPESASLPGRVHALEAIALRTATDEHRW